MTQPHITLTAPEGPEDAPLLVLGHSLGTGMLIWEDTLPTLTQRFRVTRLSLPGHDHAPVPTAAFTLDELADAVAEAVADVSHGRPVLYAGVSIGGAIALTLGLRHPAQFRAVAAVASAASLGSPEHWTQRAALVREQSTSALISASAKSWFAPDSIAREPEMTGRILHALQETSDEGYARCAEALGTYDVRARLGDIAVPVFAMGGERDTVAPEDRQDEVVAGVQHGTKVMVAGAAHQPPAEQPTVVASELVRYFEQVGA